MPRIMCHNHTLTNLDREFVTEKAERLKKYYERINEVSVILDATKRSAVAEILTFGPHLNLRFRCEAADMRTAFENAINKAERGLNKAKDKRWGDKMHRRRNVTIRRFNPLDFDFDMDLEDMETAPADTPHGFTTTDVLEPKCMTLEEASKQLAGQTKDIIVFINSQTDHLTILHRNTAQEIAMLEFEGHYTPSEEILEIPVGE
jgi:putative sigma-54 modulation protein